jgi:hypothetical protein
LALLAGQAQGCIQTGEQRLLPFKTFFCNGNEASGDF